MNSRFHDAIVKTTAGWVKGEVTEEGLRTFRGIPYGATTGEEYRWKRPRPAAPWMGVRPATQWGPVCPQGISGDYAEQDYYYSEDCLNLNIWTPAREPDEKLPVLVYIHGGGYCYGAGSEPLYRGDSLARMGMVVVTFNYRLGILGFMAHPELTAEAGASGNYALYDQLLALQWVQKNIAGFGGDPAKVTVCGQSAGGGSVLCLMAATKSNGLFRSAIVQSGQFIESLYRCRSLAEQEADGEDFVRRAGMPSVAKLRKAPVEALLACPWDKPGDREGYTPMTLAPIVDGSLLPAAPEVALAQGAGQNVTLMIGCTGAEFSPSYDPNAEFSHERYVAKLRAMFGRKEYMLRGFYEPDYDREYMQTLIRLESDEMLARAVTLADHRIQTVSAPTFVYYYSHPAASQDPKFYGAPHSSELPYLFGHRNTGGLDPRDTHAWGPWEEENRKNIQGWWYHFAATGNPNGEELPIWEAYDVNETMMVIGEDETASGPNPRKKYTDYNKKYL